MKKVLMIWIMAVSTVSFAQNKIDEERMQRDVEVAENILGTLIKQQYGRRQFFPIEVQGSYLPGYGVTFRVPSEMFGNMFFMQGGDEVWDMAPPPMPMNPMNAPGAVSYSYSTNESIDRNQAESNYLKATKDNVKGQSTKNKISVDSSRSSYQEKTLEAAQNFIADYGDLLSQLQPNEKIVVTNKTDGPNFQMAWAGSFERTQRQSLITVEGTKADVNQFRLGKMTRDQLLKKLKIVNSEISDELQPDLELLSSILNRLYSHDLSKTFFSDGNIYYERLKDYGAMYHIQVYASTQTSEDLFDMPTARLQGVNSATRDKKVKELYPEFEKSIKEDMLDYGRTIKSLNDNETLMLEINLTRCPHCGIPSTLELSVKNSVLKDYASGKISKEAALSKLVIKKGPEQ